jgi:hypothetical protein
MLSDFNFRCTQIVLIAKPACVFISITHDCFRIAIDFNASLKLMNKMMIGINQCKMFLLRYVWVGCWEVLRRV